MNLPYFSHAVVSKLRSTAAANVSKYGADHEWIAALAAGKPHVYESGRVVDPPPQLLISDVSKNDAENSKRVHQWLKGLTPALAMEERLWACLTHNIFAEYMKARWPVEDDKTVVRRYLFEDRSFAALTRNGISRLWWAGHLTHDESRPNHYELTETLFYRQDIHVSLLERALGKCQNVRFAVLDFLRENHQWLGSEHFGKRIQLLLKEVNLLGGVVLLDALPQAELQRFLMSVAQTLAEGEKAGPGA